MAERPPRVLGFDIGGANIKAASDCGRSHAVSFPLWKRPADLTTELRRVAAHFEPATHHVVTMTGEMADCFYDRREGVRAIVDQSVAALGPDVLFYTVDGEFVAAEDARTNDCDVAASNWHALATLVARWYGDEGLLIDIGSTTADFIPFAASAVTTASRTDHDRLLRGELVYVGIGRTPVCALVENLPFLGQLSPIMNEVFATTDDCALLAGLATATDEDGDTCDGRPRTTAFAANRMARMIGLDHRQVTVDDARVMAAYVIERLRARIMVATQILSSPSAAWVLAGHGADLMPVPEDRRCVDLAAAIGPRLSRVGPAYAVARLALARLAHVEVVPAAL